MPGGALGAGIYVGIRLSNAAIKGKKLHQILNKTPIDKLRPYDFGHKSIDGLKGHRLGVKPIKEEMKRRAENFTYLRQIGVIRKGRIATLRPKAKLMPELFRKAKAKTGRLEREERRLVKIKEAKHHA